jgi:hypothetical protein
VNILEDKTRTSRRPQNSSSKTEDYHSCGFPGLSHAMCTFQDEVVKNQPVLTEQPCQMEN